MIDQVDSVKIGQTIKALKIFSLSVVAIAALWGVWSVIRSRQELRTEAAFSALAQADLIEMKALRSAKVLSKDPIEVLREEADANQKEAYISALKSVIENHGGTAAAHIAALRLGRWHVESNALDSAKAIYSDLISKTEKNSDYALYFAMAVEALSVVLEKQGQNEEALLLLERALSNKSIPLRPLLLLSRARLLAVAGRKEEAKAVYADVVKEFPNSPYSQQARALSVKVSL
jgi:predicted negative regulator of RcsB-dependent stress response